MIRIINVIGSSVCSVAVCVCPCVCVLLKVVLSSDRKLIV